MKIKTKSEKQFLGVMKQFASMFGSHPTVIKSHSLGKTTETMVKAHLIARGILVLDPSDPYARFDLAFLDTKQRMVRVQCKTGRLKKRESYSVLEFTSSSRSCNYGVQGGKNKKRENRTYEGDVECFGVYCNENKKVYLVPIEHCTKRKTLLSVPLNDDEVAVGCGKLKPAAWFEIHI